MTVPHSNLFLPGDTISQWMTGVAAWHIVNGATWEGEDALVSKVRQGAQKLTPLTSRCPPRSPVTLEHLMALESSLDLNNTFDTAVWAIALICFWVCCWLGELTVPSLNLFNPSKHVARSVKYHFRNNLQNGQQLDPGQNLQNKKGQISQPQLMALYRHQTLSGTISE